MSSEIKGFLAEWKPKEVSKMSKGDRTYLLYNHINGLTEDFIKRGHQDRDSINKLFERMADKKFAKSLAKIAKTQKETPVPVGMAAVISAFLERKHKEVDEEIVEIYTSIIDKILKKRVKKLSDKLDLSPELLKDLLVVVPEKNLISSKNFVGVYVQKMLRKLYILSKGDDDLKLDSTKTIRKLFKEIFDEDLIEMIAINILLEKKEIIRNFSDKQLEMWNVLTTFALDVLEDNKKSAIEEKLEYYIKRRSKDFENNRDSARRIQLSQMADDAYPKISKIVDKLSDKDRNKKFL